jgi:hypothetical protein
VRLLTASYSDKLSLIRSTAFLPSVNTPAEIARNAEIASRKSRSETSPKRYNSQQSGFEGDAGPCLQLSSIVSSGTESAAACLPLDLNTTSLPLFKPRRACALEPRSRSARRYERVLSTDFANRRISTR